MSRIKIEEEHTMNNQKRPSGRYDTRTGKFIPGHYDTRTGAFIPDKPKKDWKHVLIVIIGVAFGIPSFLLSAVMLGALLNVGTPPETATAAMETTEAPETTRAPEATKAANAGETRVEKRNGTGTATTAAETMPERRTKEWNEWWLKKHYSDAMIATNRALENFYEKPKTSYFRDDWTISVYDENDTFYASTKFTFDGRKYDVIFIGQLVMDKDDPTRWSYAWNGHFLYAESKILYNDHYADDFLKLVGLVKETP